MTYGYYIVLIFFLFEVSGYDDSYFVSEASSDWVGKVNVCSIAVPPIQHTTSDIFVDINSTLKNSEAWVGYIKTHRLFDYIGCFKQGMIQPENVKVGSLGECFDLCNHSSLIGLSVHECFCIKDTSSFGDLRSNCTHCTAECEAQSGVACGYQTENGTNFISIYNDTQIDENITSDIDEDAHCLRLDPVKKTFFWTQCSNELLVVCEFEDICLATSTSGTNETWIESANLCFSNGGSPMHSKTCNTSNNLGKKESLPVWTSYVRSYVISSSKIQSVDSGIQFGYLWKKEGRNVLNFTKDGSEKKMILCVNQQIQTLEENKKISLLVLIAIIASTVFAVVVVMTVTVVLRRRLTKCIQRLKRNNIPHYNTPAISFIANANNARVDDTIDQMQLNQDQQIEGKHGQTNIIAVEDGEKSSECSRRKDEHDKRYSAYNRIDDIICKPGSAKIDDSQSSGENTAHNYFILEKKSQPDTKSKYDMTKFSEKTSKESDANVYNKLVIDKEQTYDHAFQTKANICTASPDTYNTIAALHSSTQSDVPVVQVQK